MNERGWLWAPCRVFGFLAASGCLSVLCNSGERFPFSLSLCLPLFTTVRPRLCRSRHLSSPSCRSPSGASSRCHRRTPASAPTLASQTVSMAPLHAAGRKRWMNTATRCTSATILTRRYRPVGLHLLSLLWWLLGRLLNKDILGMINGSISYLSAHL